MSPRSAGVAGKQTQPWMTLRFAALQSEPIFLLFNGKDLLNVSNLWFCQVRTSRATAPYYSNHCFRKKALPMEFLNLTINNQRMACKWNIFSFIKPGSLCPHFFSFCCSSVTASSGLSVPCRAGASLSLTFLPHLACPPLRDLPSSLFLEDTCTEAFHRPLSACLSSSLYGP